MEFRYQAILIPLLLVCGISQAATIYKWVDKNGVTHFSEQPPPDETQTQTLNAAELEPKPIGFDSPKPIPKNDETVSDEQKNADLVRQQNADQADAICEQAKQNLDVLSNFSRVTRKDDSTGEPVMMSDEERETALSDAKKRISLFCKDRKK
ncbi:DUF4124 domain-containing protein [Shewanella zhangzhouensis]|uniref:DUF4124 domain-containing protein n=1 Tax=Shewanella zhangzhouensis TaxID=2864213 RepID=UPI001C6612E6|nr:DUF4124 domain-containing protein [Shewanella zhangzhouensis]QYK04261.1 DUF4124 domain-containing protein [Shewanella zhangzhouensis]